MEVNQNIQPHLSQIVENNLIILRLFIITLATQPSAKSILPTDGIYGGNNALIEEALRQRQLIRDLQLDTKQILLADLLG
jgi:hypothetical protein